MASIESIEIYHINNYHCQGPFSAKSYDQEQHSVNCVQKKANYQSPT